MWPIWLRSPPVDARSVSTSPPAILVPPVRLGRLLGDGAPLRGTDAASVGAAAFALAQGATLFRVHDVRFHADALTVAALLAGG